MFLCEGLIIAPREQRPGSVADFKKLFPAEFFGTKKPLVAEQWLSDMTELMTVARIPEDNQVEVIKLHIKDMAKNWWKATEATLQKPISWDQFSKSFLERFFP